uniref:Glutamate decarboxylase 1-like n=1 Tax=Scophthalmus maximus TaxID=52904 RepID=A0A8D3D5W2_SCOMX
MPLICARVCVCVSVCVYGLHTDLLPASGGEELTRGFLQEVVNILLGYICKSSQRGSKVLDFHHPHQLKEGLEGFSMDLPDLPETLEQILVDCRDTLKYGVNTGHPRFFNQLSSGLDVIGVAGEWLTSTANTNMFTYEVSPVFILMEEVLLRKMQSIVGWSDDEGDGIFCPGGTISNLYSILVARYHFYPEVKTKGMGALPRLALFTSEDVCEISLILVKPKDMMWPIAIADICHRHTLWMHVDAAWGGGLLMSDRHSMKLQGIERAWSVTWNPHKMMGVPLQCSVILIKKRGLLQECNELGAEYLFQTDKPYDVRYDTGDKSIQCGRHVDVFKFWLMWKAKGSEGFGSQVDKCLENAEYLYDQLQRRKDFELVLKTKPEHSNVCFWYIPPSLRGLPPGPDRDTRLHQVAPRIKGRMMEKGSVLIGYQPLGTRVNFFRCVFSNPATQQEDIDFLMDEIARLGNDL